MDEGEEGKERVTAMQRIEELLGSRGDNGADLLNQYFPEDQ